MPAARLEPKRSKLELLFLVFPALFVLDLFLGFNVHIISIPGISGANIGLAIISMYAYAVYACIKTGLNAPKQIISAFFGRLDLIIAIFIVLNLLWATLIPLIMGTPLSLALEEGRVFLALMLYFPCILLARMGCLSWDSVLRFVLVAASLLAALHILLYVGEKISDGQGYAGFEAQYAGQGGFASLFFDYFNSIRLGSSPDKPDIIMGNGYIRVIYPTSILLIVGVYLVSRNVRRTNVLHCALMVLITTALCTTMTKSLWIGVLIGIGAFILFIFILVRKYRKNIIILMLTALITVSATNYFLFDSMVATRMGNIFASQDSELGNTDVPDEATGTVEANQIRVEQVAKLLEEWRGSPVIGYGYGHSAASYIRSDSQPYSYEMLLPALLMKTGVLGVLVWAAFALYVLAVIIKSRKIRPAQSGAMVFLGVCFAVSIQYNPFLLNFYGMTIMVLILTDVGLSENLLKQEK